MTSNESVEGEKMTVEVKETEEEKIKFKNKKVQNQSVKRA